MIETKDRTISSCTCSTTKRVQVLVTRRNSISGNIGSCFGRGVFVKKVFGGVGKGGSATQSESTKWNKKPFISSNIEPYGIHDME